MIISGIALQDVRLHQSETVRFESPITVIIGPNASGKTTIVEMLAMTSTGDSFRAGRVEEMITASAELGRVKVVVQDQPDTQTGTDEIEIVMTRGEVHGKKTAKRLFSVNGVRRKKKDATGLFHTVVFRPEDLRLIEGSPSRRRSFLDTPLKLAHREYEHSLSTYDQALRRRNKLLSAVREGEQPRSVLQYWNLSLIKHGQVIQRYRRKFLEAFHEVSFPLDFTVTYDPSIISQERQEEYQNRSIAAGYTLIGPHKDDFIVELHDPHASLMDEFDVATYGSRGQQRLAVLWLKFAELRYLTSVVQEKPLLLLDDILSELDAEYARLALQVAKKYQTIITSADDELVPMIQAELDDVSVVTLEKPSL